MTDADPPSPSTELDVFFTCKRCGRELFTSTQIWPHSAPSTRQGTECTSTFTTPLPWIDALGRNSGRVACFHCGYRVGYYCWSGLPCSCGHWQTPAFQFHNARVDRKRPVPITER